MSHVMNTYARLPVAFVRGEGAWLWDTEGSDYVMPKLKILKNDVFRALSRESLTLGRLTDLMESLLSFSKTVLLC